MAPSCRSAGAHTASPREGRYAHIAITFANSCGAGYAPGRYSVNPFNVCAGWYHFADTIRQTRTLFTAANRLSRHRAAFARTGL